MPNVRHAARGLVFAALLCPALAAPAGAQRAPLRGLDAYVERAMKDWQVPGLAIAVVRNDTVIYERGFGVRELGKPDPVDEHTLFPIASTSKAFTVAALGMLVDMRRLRWDDPVSRHLPSFQLRDPWISRELTVRDLLTHRSGLSRSDNLWIAAPFDRAEVLRRASTLPNTASFRSTYGYNNIAFIAAGEIVGALAGTSWDDFVAQRIFRPLGMTRSTTRSAVVAERSNVAAPHLRSGGRIIASTLRNYDNIGGAGAIFSSAHDMAQWLRLQLNGGVFGADTLIRPATLREMHTPQMLIRLDTTSERRFPSTHFQAYGLGWLVQDYRGEKVVHHSGSINWTRTHVMMVPGKRIGVVAIANLSSSNLQYALAWRVIDALLGAPAHDWSEDFLEPVRRAEQRSAALPAPAPDSGRVLGTKPSLALEQYAGTYTSEVYGDVRVALENGALVLSYAPDYVADLEHWHFDTFRGAWRRAGFGRALVTFRLDGRARVAALELEDFGEFRRVRAAGSD